MMAALTVWPPTESYGFPTVMCFREEVDRTFLWTTGTNYMYPTTITAWDSRPPRKDGKIEWTAKDIDR